MGKLIDQLFKASTVIITGPVSKYERETVSRSVTAIKNSKNCKAKRKYKQRRITKII